MGRGGRERNPYNFRAERPGRVRARRSARQVAVLPGDLAGELRESVERLRLVR
jgi:hypothetical protein